MAGTPRTSPSPLRAAPPRTGSNPQPADGEGPRREVIILSPRESPSPPAPTLRVVAASPPPLPPATDYHVPQAEDPPRSLLRLLASSAGTPTPSNDPSLLTPDLYYDATGRLRTTSRNNSRVRRVEWFSPAPSTLTSSASTPRVRHGTDDEQEDAEALFVSTLRAGDSSQQRRRIDPSSADPEINNIISGTEYLVTDTGWVPLDGSGAGSSARLGPEVSPEEVRAAREAWALDFWTTGASATSSRLREAQDARAVPFAASLADADADADGWGSWIPPASAVQQIQVDSAAESAWETARRQFEAMQSSDTGWGVGESIWRNEPHSIPRSVNLPRGGRSFRPLSTFGPTNPPVGADGIERPGYRSLRSTLGRPGQTNSQTTLETDGETTASSDHDEGGEEVGEREWASLETDAFAAPRDDPWRTGEAEMEQIWAHSGRGAGSPAQRGDRQSASPRRRTREETNALMGAALRSKKPVLLLYCGGPGGGADGEPERQRLPSGFSWAPRTDAAFPATAAAAGGVPDASRGCGALVCARALLEGVPVKVFEDEGKEEPAASSDLPPCSDKVADLGGPDGEDSGERVGKRGWRGCKGCLTRDVGCKRCGNHLGYRLLRPCVTCSISRPTYTSYASAVSSVAAPQPLVLSAGGVTGGGVVDGLLFHYRLGSVTPIARLVGRQPAEELEAEERARALRGESGWDGEDDDAIGGVGRDLPQQGTRNIASASATQVRWSASDRRNPPAIRRLREKPPQAGDLMRWKSIPSAQRDFQDGLVGEPGDWIDPEGETWWLDNAIAKHARKRTASGAFGSGGSEGGASYGMANTDRLSTASTTIVPSSVMPSPAPTASSPSGSTLSRSHAIRLRVPLSGSSSSTGGGSPVTVTAREAALASGLYDRYRADAASFARRVRRRTAADPSAAAAAAAGDGVVRSLERAGYGSGFALELEGDAARDARGVGESDRRRAPEVVGR